jgi:hypothetical protein
MWNPVVKRVISYQSPNLRMDSGGLGKESVLDKLGMHVS